MSFQGKKNRYTCERDPKHVVTTVDRDAGTTPFMIACETCKNAGFAGKTYRYPMMVSSMYRVPQGYPATHEWYAPDKAERDRETPAVRQHIDMGGLLLREIAP